MMKRLILLIFIFFNSATFAAEVKKINEESLSSRSKTPLEIEQERIHKRYKKLKKAIEVIIDNFNPLIEGNETFAKKYPLFCDIDFFNDLLNIKIKYFRYKSCPFDALKPKLLETEEQILKIVPTLVREKLIKWKEKQFKKIDIQDIALQKKINLKQIILDAEKQILEMLNI